jgi:hypothetical protein
MTEQVLSDFDGVDIVVDGGGGLRDGRYPTTPNE